MTKAEMDKRIAEELAARARYTGNDYVKIAQAPNTLGFSCDEYGVIQNGEFKGCILDHNICEGNDSFKKMEKCLKIIQNIWLAVYMGIMLWMMYLIKTTPSKMDPRLPFEVLIPLAIAFQIYLAVAAAIKKKKILESAYEYKAVLFDVRGRRSGKSTIKECDFAIWDNGKVRIIREFIAYQPFNRLSSIRKDRALIGQTFTVMASPDEAGFCIRQ